MLRGRMMMSRTCPLKSYSGLETRGVMSLARLMVTRCTNGLFSSFLSWINGLIGRVWIR